MDVNIFVQESIDTLVGSSESYKFYEPVPLGPYTVQFWSVSSLQAASSSHSNVVSERQKFQFRSYLPQGTCGLRLPRFTCTMRPDKHQKNDPHCAMQSLAFNSTGDLSMNGIQTWQMAIYKNGDVLVKPQEDEDLVEFSWVHQPGPWMNQIFTKEQVCRILLDISRKFEPSLAMGADKLVFNDYNSNALLMGVV